MKKLAVLKDSMDLGDLHLFKQLADKSRDLPQENYCCQTRGNSQNNNYFHSKWSKIVNYNIKQK